MSPRLATFVMFVINGAVIGTWIAALPGIQERLGATATEMGIVLFCAALGALASQQVTGQLLVRVSSRRLLRAVSAIYPLLIVLPLMAPDIVTLAIVIVVFGAFNTAMDVAMNAHGVVLEDRGEKSILSGLHAGWSIGGVISSVGVAAAVLLGLDPLIEGAVAGVVFWLAALGAGRFIGQGSVRTEGATGIHWPPRAVLPIALLIVLIAFVEGGLSDWGGIYLRQGVGAEAGIAAFAYGAFSLGLFLGRVGGDRAKDRIGSIRLIQLGMLLAAVAITLFLLVGNAAVAVVGMVVAGVGIGNAIPQLFGAAARIHPPGPSLSAAFTFLTFAFIGGPLIIGRTADAAGVPVALGLLAVAAVVSAFGITRVPSAETNPRLAAATLANGRILEP